MGQKLRYPPVEKSPLQRTSGSCTFQTKNDAASNMCTRKQLLWPLNTQRTCTRVREGWLVYQNRVCACAQRTGAAVRELLWQDRPGGLCSLVPRLRQRQSFSHARCCHSSRKPHTVGYLSFGPMVQCVMHALKGLACCARVSLRLARLPRTASSAQLSRRICSSRAAAPGPLAHAEVTKSIIFFQ